MANNLSPEVMAQFQANGWIPPQPATAVNVQAAAPPPLQPSDNIYGSPQMAQEIHALGPIAGTQAHPKLTLMGAIGMGPKTGNLTPGATDAGIGGEGGEAAGLSDAGAGAGADVGGGAGGAGAAAADL